MILKALVDREADVSVPGIRQVAGVRAAPAPHRPGLGVLRVPLADQLGGRIWAMALSWRCFSWSWRFFQASCWPIASASACASGWVVIWASSAS